MDFMDIYDDLDEFHEKEEKKNKEYLELEAKYNEALKTIDAMNMEKKDLRKKIRIMEHNLQSLLDTAKAEIRRKDKVIEDLRKEKDDICFRRRKAPAAAVADSRNETATNNNQRTQNFYQQPIKTEIQQNVTDEAVSVDLQHGTLKIETNFDKGPQPTTSDALARHLNPFKYHTPGSSERSNDYTRSKAGRNDHWESKERRKDRSKSKERRYDRSRSKERQSKRSRSNERLSRRSRSNEKLNNRSKSKERRYDEIKHHAQSSVECDNKRHKIDDSSYKSGNQNNRNERNHPSCHRRDHNGDSGYRRERHERKSPSPQREKDKTNHKSHDERHHDSKRDKSRETLSSKNGERYSKDHHKDREEHRKHADTIGSLKDESRNRKRRRNDNGRAHDTDCVGSNSRKEKGDFQASLTRAAEKIKLELESILSSEDDNEDPITAFKTDEKKNEADNPTADTLSKASTQSNYFANLEVKPTHKTESEDNPIEDKTINEDLQKAENPNLTKANPILSTPKRIAIFDALFGASPGKNKSQQTSGAGELLANIKEMLDHCGGSSVTTSMDAYTDVSDDVSRTGDSETATITTKTSTEQVCRSPSSVFSISSSVENDLKIIESRSQQRLGKINMDTDEVAKALGESLAECQKISKTSDKNETPKDASKTGVTVAGKALVVDDDSITTLIDDATASIIADAADETKAATVVKHISIPALPAAKVLESASRNVLITGEEKSLNVITAADITHTVEAALKANPSLVIKELKAVSAGSKLIGSHQFIVASNTQTTNAATDFEQCITPVHIKKIESPNNLPKVDAPKTINVTYEPKEKLTENAMTTTLAAAIPLPDKSPALKKPLRRKSTALKRVTKQKDALAKASTAIEKNVTSSIVQATETATTNVLVEKKSPASQKLTSDKIVASNQATSASEIVLDGSNDDKKTTSSLVPATTPNEALISGLTSAKSCSVNKEITSMTAKSSCEIKTSSLNAPDAMPVKSKTSKEVPGLSIVPTSKTVVVPSLALKNKAPQMPESLITSSSSQALPKVVSSGSTASNISASKNEALMVDSTKPEFGDISTAASTEILSLCLTDSETAINSKENGSLTSDITVIENKPVAVPLNQADLSNAIKIKVPVHNNSQSFEEVATTDIAASEGEAPINETVTIGSTTIKCKTNKSKAVARTLVLKLKSQRTRQNGTQAASKKQPPTNKRILYTKPIEIYSPPPLPNQVAMIDTTTTKNYSNNATINALDRESTKTSATSLITPIAAQKMAQTVKKVGSTDIKVLKKATPTNEVVVTETSTPKGDSFRNTASTETLGLHCVASSSVKTVLNKKTELNSDVKKLQKSPETVASKTASLIDDFEASAKLLETIISDIKETAAKSDIRSKVPSAKTVIADSILAENMETAKDNLTSIEADVDTPKAIGIKEADVKNDENTLESITTAGETVNGLTKTQHEASQAVIAGLQLSGHLQQVQAHQEVVQGVEFEAKSLADLKLVLKKVPTTPLSNERRDKIEAASDKVNGVTIPTNESQDVKSSTEAHTVLGNICNDNEDEKETRASTVEDASQTVTTENETVQETEELLCPRLFYQITSDESSSDHIPLVQLQQREKIQIIENIRLPTLYKVKQTKAKTKRNESKTGNKQKGKRVMEKVEKTKTNTKACQKGIKSYASVTKELLKKETKSVTNKVGGIEGESAPATDATQNITSKSKRNSKSKTPEKSFIKLETPKRRKRLIKQNDEVDEVIAAKRTKKQAKKLNNSDMLTAETSPLSLPASQLAFRHDDKFVDIDKNMQAIFESPLKVKEESTENCVGNGNAVDETVLKFEAEQYELQQAVSSILESDSKLINTSAEVKDTSFENKNIEAIAEVKNSSFDNNILSVTTAVNNSSFDNKIEAAAEMNNSSFDKKNIEAMAEVNNFSFENKNTDAKDSSLVGKHNDAATELQKSMVMTNASFDNKNIEVAAEDNNSSFENNIIDALGEAKGSSLYNKNIEVAAEKNNSSFNNNTIDATAEVKNSSFDNNNIDALGEAKGSPLDNKNIEGAAVSKNSSFDHSFESKRLSLGASEYLIERVSENVVTMFVTRKRRKKPRDSNVEGT